LLLGGHGLAGCGFGDLGIEGRGAEEQESKPCKGEAVAAL
jgi:hypothetical protein